MAAAKLYVETERLRLRDWRDVDAEPFAALNADPRVMEFFPKPLAREESDALVGRERAEIARRGYGLYAAEEKDTGAFIGFVGLAEVGFAARFTPAIEVAWRLARSSWGKGFATEGCTGRRRRRIHSARPGFPRRVHGGLEPAVAPRHGKDRHDP